MNTVSTPRELETLLNQWEARWRYLRVMRLFPRILSAALLVGIALAFGLAALQMLPASALVGVVVGVVSALTVVFSGGLRVFGRQGMAAARHFDQTFGLQERMSTALELLRGEVHTTPELTDFQLEDTFSRAREIDPRKELRLTVRWQDWLLAFVLLVIFALVLTFVSLRTAAGENALSEETRLAVASAESDVRDITEDIATDSGLTDEERETLLESLEVSLDELQAEDLTSEDAFVEMSELEAELRSEAAEIREEVAQQQAAQNAASDALDPLADTPQETTFEQQLEEVAETLPELDEAQQEEVADSLEEAAEALEETDPETAEELREAAEALREGDAEGAESALDDAQENAAESQQAQQQRSESAQNLEEAADQAGSAADEIAESEASDSEPQPSLPEDVPQAPAEEGASGGEAQEGETAQQGPQGQITTDDEDAPSGNVSGDADTENVEEGGGEETTGGDQETGVGAGTNQTESRQEGSSSQQSTQNLGTNESSGTGESQYENVYAPDTGLPDAAGDGVVELEAAEGDTSTQSGEFQDNPSGSAQTPYNEVFREYADSASRTLESETIPLGMRDVVRDYFNALAPQEP